MPAEVLTRAEWRIIHAALREYAAENAVQHSRGLDTTSLVEDEEGRAMTAYDKAQASYTLLSRIGGLT